MNRKRFLTVFLIVLSALLLFPAFALGGSDTIKLTIVSDTSTGDWGDKTYCVHFYTVSKGGVEIISKTPLPHNKTTVIELPKVKEQYIVNFIREGIYAGGQPVPPKVLDTNYKFIGSQSAEITFECFLRGGGHGIVTKGGHIPGLDILNSDAASGAGETSVPVAAAIVVLLAGAAASVAGAAASTTGAAAGASEGSGDESSGGSTYKMCIYKEFGDKIKYNGAPVSVYARMVEINSEGEEIPRIDLTQRIEIFSNDAFMEIGTPTILGDYMGAVVSASTNQTTGFPKEGTISFRFTGEGGVFQNNVRFKMVGECYIGLEGPKLFVHAFSGKCFEMVYELVDFLYEAEASVHSMKNSIPFDLEIGKNKDGKPVIIAAEREEKKPFETFFNSFECEIVAKNDKEYARTVFDVVMCYEGILPDFLGKKKEIIAYENEKGEMPVTDIAFRLGIWDETQQALNISRPNDIEVRFTDKQGIYDLIGLSFSADLEKSTSDYLLYAFKAEKSLPNTSPVAGELIVNYTSDSLSFENSTNVKLMPDLATVEKDREKEYRNCVKIIDTYLPERFRANKHKELNAGYSKMGLQDLYLFRRKCWEIASRCIMQEKESYLIDTYWYDEAIATSELVVYVGDIALDVALAPFGGPITGFVIAQVKTSLIELISMRIENGSIGFEEIYELVVGRLEQAAGQADGLIETPGFDKPKALVAWLSCYILYRIMYHWYFDVEDNGEPKGLFEAIQSGLMDFAGKGASMLLGEFAKDIAKKRGIDVGSTADKEQTWVNEKVSEAAKKGLDKLDSVAGALDKKINDITAALLDYIDRIRNGGINIH